jgi:nucleoside-diphosphate-sugar epimerase
MPVLVTGAAGHLGANLVRRLLADGESVRVLVRPGSNNAATDGLSVERVSGDLRQPSTVAAAVQGCRQVYHCAATVSTVAGGEREIYDCNVLGTRNLLEAARAAGVERVVVSGSLSAVGNVPGRPSDESMPFYPFDEHLAYGHTKALVEHECWRAVCEGLDVVVAVSCAILGPHDYKPSRMGKVLLDFANGAMRAYIPGGFEFVTARDIAEGHVLAMRKGRKGQRYIFASGYHEVDDLMAMMSRVTGRPLPPLRLPAPVMAVIAAVVSPVLTRLFPRVDQRLTPAAVRLLTQRRRADCTKAKTELGFVPTPVENAVREAYEDFVRRGLVREPRGTVAQAASPARSEPSTIGASP